MGDWNASNAESFIRYTVNKGYTIHGWELGNSSIPYFLVDMLKAIYSWKAVKKFDLDAQVMNYVGVELEQESQQTNTLRT